MTASHFIEPLDVLFLRGNRLFGEPGSYGESLVPPWPSVAAGALRSALLAHKRIDPVAFGEGAVEDDELGTPDRPGSFRVAGFYLARRGDDGRVEALRPLPADLVVSRDDGGAVAIEALRPVSQHPRVASSCATAHLPVLPERERAKPDTGFWLTQAGWERYVRGELPARGHLVSAGDLWRLETRTGVGLDPAARRAADGQLFSVQAVSLGRRGQSGDFDVGFLLEVTGAAVPADIALRLGGDGRAAVARAVDVLQAAEDYDAIAAAGRCRLVMASPGIFDSGWLPPGVSTEGGVLRFSLHGVSGRVVCAAVPRAEVVSGWDLARRRPKPACRVVPAGSVYWLDDIEATPDALRKLAGSGLWAAPGENPTRQAEGFNRVTVAAWTVD